MARKTRRRHTKPKEEALPVPVTDDAMRRQKIADAIEAAVAPIRARIDEQDQRHEKYEQRHEELQVELGKRDLKDIFTAAGPQL